MADRRRPRKGTRHERFGRDMFAVAGAAGAGRFIRVGFSMAGKFARYMAQMEPGRVIGQVLIAPGGVNAVPLPREIFAPWYDAAPYRDRFRPILESFMKAPARDDLRDLYCRNLARTSRTALEQTIEMSVYTSV